MADLELVSGVSTFDLESLSTTKLTVGKCIEEFALLEVSYTVVRLIQLLPKIEFPPTEPNLKVGDERQHLTLVLSCAEGYTVSMQG